MILRSLPTLISCIAAGLFCGVDASAAPATFQLRECEFAQLLGSSAAARCGRFQVAENRDDPASRTIELRITVIPSLRLQPEPDPLVLISGGPGQSATDFYASTGAAFAAIRRDRDILIVDQRGTGASQPLDCAFDSDADLVIEEPQQLRRLGEACLAKLPGDPRFYTTSVAVRDLDEIRAALGYEKLNLYGVSYGTRVAQHYLRRYPQRVRSLILDGVVPVDLALGPDIAPRAQAALDAIFDRCTADRDCAAAFPDARDQFRALRTRLEREPVVAHLPDPVSAQWLDAKFGSQHLNAAVRLLTYSDETASLLPLLIHQAQSQQQVDALVAQYLMIERTMDLQFAYGMHFAVVCSEDAPRWDSQPVAEAVLEATYLGANFMRGMRAVCDIWPRGVVDEGFNAQLHSDVPALILSGGNDPVTPAAYGERVLASFAKGRHLVLDGQGHGQLATGCMPRLLAKFVRSADAGGLDATCLDGVRPAPFMLTPAATAP
ncbi:MAG TPA: alpha/beta fold hydrolase [Povalibacter sp.]|uniref:alpha/beta fold hydrolase n=1 Tax=Povalibacter sp. TaxID=1962978 RepID=UPI002C91CA14|nr:alpha/beta fold hydrolase [Povalibacter sp.]HMN46597.1 alpha/beta fold hydrolase [Povalibacter sp.]